MGTPIQLDAFADEEAPARVPSPSPISPAAFSPEEPAEDDKGEDPDWHWRENAEDIVLEEQRRIAVYRNPVRSIVIREESPDGEREDAFVVLRDDEAAKALIAQLQREIGVKVR